MKIRSKYLISLLLCVISCGLGAVEAPVRIAVLDFVNPDIAGQRKFLNFESKPIRISKECSLNNADRAAMNSVMQGYVRLMDAQDASATNAANRALQLRDNEFNRTKTLALYQSIVHGEARPMLLGADYLTAELAKHPDAFAAVDGNLVRNAMQKLQNVPDFPADFMLKIAQETGATHIAYGSIADLHSKLKSYRGYGIETKTVTYELDVLVKVADLPAQKIIYSKVYTGVLQERDMSTGGTEIDGNKYQTLMKSAMAQAGEDLYARFRPGKADSFQITPIPPRAVAPAAAASPAPASAAAAPAAEPKPAPAPAPTAPRRHETVIIQQAAPTVPGTVPPPPVPVPVAADGNAVVIVSGGRTAAPVVVNQQ